MTDKEIDDMFFKEYDYSELTDELTDEIKEILRNTFAYSSFKLCIKIEELKEELKTIWLFKVLYKVFNKIN